MVSLPVELKIVFPTYGQQIVNQASDGALGL